MRLLPLIALLVLGLAAGPAQAQEADAKTTPGEVIFCDGIDAEWNPQNPRAEFETNQVSAIFKNAGEAKFGRLEVVFSIYRNVEAGAQEMIHRETVPINNEWTMVLIKDVPLPGVGSYTFLLTTTDGKSLSSGDVKVLEKKVDEPIPEKVEFQGTDLGSLFDQYKRKAVSPDKPAADPAEQPAAADPPAQDKPAAEPAATDPPAQDKPAAEPAATDPPAQDKPAAEPAAKEPAAKEGS